MSEMIEQLDAVVMEVAKIRQISDKQAESVKQISDAVEQVNGLCSLILLLRKKYLQPVKNFLHLLKVWMRWYLILFFVNKIRTDDWHIVQMR